MKKKFQNVSINGLQIPIELPPSKYVSIVMDKPNEMVIVNEHGQLFHFDKPRGNWTHLKGADGLRAKPLKDLLLKLLP